MKTAGLGLVLVLVALCVAPPSSGRSVTSRRSTAPAPPNATPSDPTRDAYAQAVAPALGDSSRTRLRAFIARHPHHPLVREAWLELGTLAYALGEYAEARDAFRRARGGAVIERAKLWEARSLLALGTPREARALAQPIARGKTGARWEAGELVALAQLGEGNRPGALMSYRVMLGKPDARVEPSALFQAIQLANESAALEEARAWRARLIKSFPRSPEAASARVETTAPAPADDARAKSR